MPERSFVREAAARRLGVQAPGDPTAAARALPEVVDAAQPPLRVLFGVVGELLPDGRVHQVHGWLR
jgi:hypothetical protein